VNQAVEQTDPKQQRRKLLIIFGLFLAPLVLALLAWLSVDYWHTGAPTSHGELVDPARPLTEFTLQGLDGRKVNLESLRGKWTLIYVASSSCPQECLDVLTALRQLHIALNKDMDRVQRLLVLTDDQDLAVLRIQLEKFQGMRAALQTGLALDLFLDQLRLEGEVAPITAGRVYMVDPLGNFMMSYPRGADPTGILRDLEKLLKLSRIG
jgi:cytochrome oxidase Cu insertion factor (SCO1/SenC/PrrC family)